MGTTLGNAGHCYLTAESTAALADFNLSLTSSTEVIEKQLKLILWDICYICRYTHSSRLPSKVAVTKKNPGTIREKEN